ncbi:MAG: hypothetical protein HY355_06505, partial [Armatimonadetes bacterium]|nr:hypothetical protein [Armatimonadota bacterium]
PAAHGPLIVSGFLATLIGLERAVALGGRWPYAAPLLTALGALGLIAGLPGPVGPLLTALGSLGLLAVFAVIIRRQPTLATMTMAAGAVAWAGNALWLGALTHVLVARWAGFLALIIVGERLELSQLARPPRWSLVVFVAALYALLIGLALAVYGSEMGFQFIGASMIAFALWLWRHDLARHTVRQDLRTRAHHLSSGSG